MLVPVNHRLAAPEVEHQLTDARPAALFVHPDHDGLADAALTGSARVPRRLVLTRSALDALAGAAGSENPPPVSDDDPLLLMYTSGTTGRPKGAVLTHANCFWTNLSLDRTADVTTTDAVLQVLPQFHVGGWNVQPLLAWWKGATVVLEPGFDPARVLELIARKRVTTMMGVPATYLFLAEQPDFARADLSSLRVAVVGGAPMPEALLRTWAARGVDIVQGYGLTEAAPNVLCVPPEYAARKLGAAGRPYPHVQAALLDPDAGTLRGGAGIGGARGRRTERVRGLLAGSGGDRGGVRVGGRPAVAADRRHRRARRRRLLTHPRPGEGHVRLRRRERLPGGGRGGAARAPGRGRDGRGRRPARALG